MRSVVPILLLSLLPLMVPGCRNNPDNQALLAEASSRLVIVHEGCYRLSQMQPEMLDSRENFTSTLDSLIDLPGLATRVEQNDTLLAFLGHTTRDPNRVNDAAEKLMIRHWKSAFVNQPAGDSLLHAYTSLLTCWFILGNTGRIVPFPWHTDLKFSAANRENRLLVTGSCTNTHTFTLVFHAPEDTDLPEDPAWKLPSGFTIEPGGSYTVEHAGGESGRLTGKQLLEGLPVTWEPGKKHQVIIYRNNR